MPAFQKYADGLIQAAGLFIGLLLMFLPMVLVYKYQSELSSGGVHRGVEVSVGVAVILRTTFRRLLRVGTSNLLRTSLGAISRTSARTMTRTITRRVARTSARILMGILSVRPDETPTEPLTTRSSAARLNGIAIGLGFGSLALSFGYVVSRLLATGQAVLEPAGSGNQYSIAALSILAACPLLLYAAAAYAMAWWFGCRIRVQTALDGLLLQAYYAGAGSFLPMTTDVEYQTSESTRFRVSLGVLIVLYAAHLLLLAAGAAFQQHEIKLLSMFLLVYCFVYSFPIRPLEGFSVWRGSKVVWALLWVPILVSFLTSLPAAFVDVL